MESRRDFLKKAAVAAAGLTIVPSKTIAGLGHKAPSDTFCKQKMSVVKATRTWSA